MADAIAEGRRVNSVGMEDCRVILGGPATTDEIVESLRDVRIHVDSRIRQRNFPLRPCVAKKGEIVCLRRKSKNHSVK